MSATPWKTKSLVLNIDDVEYSIPPINYDDGMTLLKLTQGEKTSRINTRSADSMLFELCMGEAWQAMRDNRVPFPAAFRAGFAALEFQLALVVGMDIDAAVATGEAFWENGSDPEAVGRQLAANLMESQQPAASTRSTSTASARKTRSPGSTRTTTSRQGTRRTNSKPPRATTGSRSRGSSSSSSGR